MLLLVLPLLLPLFLLSDVITSVASVVLLLLLSDVVVDVALLSYLCGSYCMIWLLLLPDMNVDAVVVWCGGWWCCCLIWMLMLLFDLVVDAIVWCECWCCCCLMWWMMMMLLLSDVKIWKRFLLTHSSPLSQPFHTKSSSSSLSLVSSFWTKTLEEVIWCHSFAIKSRAQDPRFTELADLWKRISKLVHKFLLILLWILMGLNRSSS